MILDVGAKTRTGAQSAVGIIFLGIIVTALESFARRAYVESRLTAALALQKQTARDAQRALLDNVVPPHAVAGLITWMERGFRPRDTVAGVQPAAVMSAHLTKFEVPGPSSPQQRDRWLLEAHRVLDALLERCLFLEKVKTCGDSVLLAGPFGDALTAHPGGEDAAVASALWDAVFLTKTLTQLGVGMHSALHVGAALTCLLGSLRPSFDTLGPAVITARELSNHGADHAEELLADAGAEGSPRAAGAGGGGMLPAFGAIPGVGEEIRLAPAGQLLLISDSALAVLAQAASHGGNPPRPDRVPVCLPHLAVDATQAAAAANVVHSIETANEAAQRHQPWMSGQHAESHLPRTTRTNRTGGSRSANPAGTVPGRLHLAANGAPRNAGAASHALSFCVATVIETDR